jgi:hypothetical protein
MTAQLELRRRLTREALKAYGIAFQERGEAITLSIDDLARLVVWLLEQHHQLHQVAELIERTNPIVAVAKRVDDWLDAHHGRFPISEGMKNIGKDHLQTIYALFNANTDPDNIN